jgi:cellulose 1,4-beta-cellobiosidase
MYPILKKLRGRSLSRVARALLTLAGIATFATAAFAQHVANPFVGATQYLNPDYTTEIESAVATANSSSLAAQMKVVENYPTAVWLDRIAAVAGGTANNGRLGLAQHITTALAQQSGTAPVVITLVIYDLPDRDCSALASNGEISITGDGTLSGLQQYEQNYITPIYNILQSYATNPNLRFVLVIEPDSLPNLITNTGMGASPVPNCVAANGGVSGSPSLSSVYVEGVQYALNTFHPLTNAYQYLDIGQSAWLGWPNNLAPAIQMYNGLVKGTTAGYASIDGFISNTANYVPTQEPFMTGTQQIGGSPVISSDFYQYDPNIDELNYDQAFYAAATGAGFPSSIGFLIDTSRNGWGGTLRPAAASTAADVNTFVKASKIDKRGVRGVWCNIQDSGMGVPPTVNPGGFANLQAYVWIKPPGESDGTYPGSTYGGVTSTTGDPNCNPANTNALAGGATDSLPNSPPAGTFWATEFAMNVQNAYPPIASSGSTATTPGFDLSATAVTVAPGATGNSTVTIINTDGFTGAVALAFTGLPDGVTASFSPQSVTGPGSSTLVFTAASTAVPGTSNVTVTGTSGTVTSTATIALTIGSGSAGSPTLSVASASLSVAQGASVTDHLTLMGLTGDATLSASGLPSGVTASFSINPANSSSVLQLSAGSTAAAGPATIIVSAISGTQAASASIGLTVVPPTVTGSFRLSASNASLMVPQGQGGTSMITVTGVSGFNGSVALAVAITENPTSTAKPPTVSFSTNSPVSVTGTTPGVATLTIATTAKPATTCIASGALPGELSWKARGGALLAGVLLFLLPRRRFTGKSMLSLMLLFVIVAGGTVACAGNAPTVTCPNVTNPGTTTGTYVITVTGTAGAITQTEKVTVTVQ